MVESLPLEQKTCARVIQGSNRPEKYPALHQIWKEDVFFVLYTCPLHCLDTAAAVDEWLDEATTLEEDLHWLLRLAHHCFWSQIVHDETLQATIDSFLKSCPRFFDDCRGLPDEVQRKQSCLNKLFFLVLVRLSTCKESQVCHITPAAFGNLLYNTYLLDIPKMMDICAIFGNGNEAILSRMLGNIFLHQPNYFDDLVVAAGCIRNAFESMSDRCRPVGGDGAWPIKLGAKPKGAAVPTADGANDSGCADLSSLLASDLEDLVLYAFDVVFTLKAFVDVYPAGGTAFHKDNFYAVLSNFHDEALEALRLELHRRRLRTYRLCSGAALKSKVTQMSQGLVKAFRSLLSHNCLRPLLEGACNGAERASLVDGYLDILSATLSDRNFLHNYNCAFPVEDDVDLFTQLDVKLDKTRLAYIRSGLTAVTVISSDSSSHISSKKPVGPSASERSLSAQAAAEVPADTEEYNDQLGACAASIKMSDIEVASLISSVQDLLPDLGEGFLEECLREYDYSVEKVVNAVLESSLSASLRSLDRKMPKKKDVRPTAVLETRKNVFDNDEFDIFTKDNIDKSKVHKGKMTFSNSSSASDKQMVTDKVKSLVISQYEASLAERRLAAEGDGGAGIYDDEYDDTYDTNEVGADDDDSADELLGRRVVKPRILAGRVEKAEEEDESESDSDEKTTAGTASRAEQTSRVGNMPSRDHAAQRKNYDVQGKPKGHGQTADVVHNRAFKERHKSRGANHNRKAMSDRKRHTGMIF